MEKKDRFFAFISAIAVAVLAFIFELDYSKISESGLTLASIVLAVYIAAIVGLINSDLAKKMQNTVSPQQKDKTQLGVLARYFKAAIFSSIITILISSLILLLPSPNQDTKCFLCYLWTGISIVGLVFYVENLVFLIMIVRFILNRQIWNA